MVFIKAKERESTYREKDDIQTDLMQSAMTP